jgi:hypothetical protein
MVDTASNTAPLCGFRRFSTWGRSISIGFELLDTCSQVLVAGQQLAYLNEGADDQDVHLDGAGAAEHRRRNPYKKTSL